MKACVERDSLALWSRRTLMAGVASSLAWPLAADTPLADIHLVSDAWHGLTRKDGTGLYFDLIRAVYARRKIKLRITIYPYARTVQTVKDKRTDARVASFLNEKDFALYPRWHFDRNVQQALFRRRPGYRFGGTSDLRDKRVAWLRDFGLDKYLKVPMKIVEVDTTQGAMQMLEAGRIDYFIGAQSDIADDIKARSVEMRDFELASVTHLGLYLAFANTPRGEALLRIWDEKMETFHRSDAFKAIYKNAGVGYPF